MAALPAPATPAQGGGAAAPPPSVPTGFTLIVCGGRQFRGLWAVGNLRQALGALPRPSLVLHGCCSGADVSAASWAFAAGIPVLGFPAHWSRHGRAAGPIRNAEMLAHAAARGLPRLVVAFPGGAGTRSMVTLARQHLVPVWQPLG